jgi:hypothetical protein
MLWDALSVGEGPHGEAVRTVFTWSYRELPPDAARMFRALGLHPGPDISLEAAAAAVGVPARAARRTLDILLGAFLVQSVRPHRYQLHDLLRAYALDQGRTIDSDDQRLDALDRMLRWYITAASKACSALFPGDIPTIDVPPPDGPQPPAFENATAAFEWFDTERPNLVAAARAALDAGLDRRGWELAMALDPIHASYHTFDDWSVLSGVAVTAAERIADTRMLADALANRGGYFFRRRALDEARAMHDRARALREETGDQPGILQSLNSLGLIGLRTRQLAEASAYFADVAERARRGGDRFWDGIGRMNQAEAYLEGGNAALGLQTVGPLPDFFASLHDADSRFPRRARRNRACPAHRRGRQRTDLGMGRMPADQLTGHGLWWQVYVEFTNWAASEQTFARHVEPLLRAARDDRSVDAWWFMRKHPCW